jgi:hypothetical protein
MKTCDEISGAGTKCGASLLAATEDMCDASGAAGPGMAWRHQVEVFEMMLDSVCDGLRFYGDRAEHARTLFLANARIEFYGVHAPKDKPPTWRNDSSGAYQELSRMEREAA